MVTQNRVSFLGLPTLEQGDKFKTLVAHTRLIKVESPPGARPCDFNENVPDREGGEMALKCLKIRDVGESNRQLR